MNDTATTEIYTLIATLFPYTTLFRSAGQTLTFTVEETGHFQRFVPRTIGTVKIEKAGKYTLAVKPKTKPKGAVMDLRRVTLKSTS